MTDVPGVNVAGLDAWLARAHPERSARPLRVEVISGGRSNLTYAVTGPRVPLVLRRPPLGHVLASAHDMRREHRVISALAGSAVPVPVAVDLVDDTVEQAVTGTHFFVMERSPGIVLAHRRQNSRYSRAGLHSLSIQLVEHLADLHAVDPSAVGLDGFGRPDGYLARQLSTWRRQLEASRSRDTPFLDRLATGLDVDVPASARASIVHGDFRLDNALVVGDVNSPRISAVLDWEMATLGDPLVDLGMLALYWDLGAIPDPATSAAPSAVDPVAGYPSAAELVEAYAAHAGNPVPDLGWYRAFAAFKLAVILEGIHFRYRAGDTVGDGYERIGTLVEPLARQGLEVH
ncbi:phosphotransferase family protein [uncultured Demequina sp.]|uniref:phosphotransferase family protein n=1 Tax=uncultured Demequina sp. TaxID=693499 RepID=UPI0025E8FFDB|nr:phosphotransferase family protein [uncultured Demequina sp.]